MNKQLIKHVQIKFGRSIKFQRDIKELKEDIYFVTGEIIGFNTLRRAFGLLKQVDPSSKTLKVLSNYVGFRWGCSHLALLMYQNSSLFFYN